MEFDGGRGADEVADDLFYYDDFGFLHLTSIRAKALGSVPIGERAHDGERESIKELGERS